MFNVYFGRMRLINVRYFLLLRNRHRNAKSPVFPTSKTHIFIRRNLRLVKNYEFSEGLLHNHTRRFSTQHTQPEPDECFLLVENLKLFVVLHHAFNLSTEEFDKYFYAARIRINKQRIGGKQVKIKENDLVDLIKGCSKTHVYLKRVHVKSIKQSKPYRMEVEVWDTLTLPRILTQEKQCLETQTQD